MAIIVDRRNGIIVDTDTGEVLEDRIIDDGADWRAFSAEEFNRKAHAYPIDPSIHDYGLHTFIELDPPSKFRDAVRRHTAIRLLRSNNRVRVEPKSRKVVGLLQMLHSYADLIGLPKDVVDDAAIILRRALKVMAPNLHFNKRNRDEYIIALLIISAKRMNIPISISEVVKKLQERGIAVSRFVVEEAVWKILSSGVAGRVWIDPRSYIPKLVSGLKLGQDVATLASTMISILRGENRLAGRKPSGVAAAAVYIAAKILGYEVRMKDVADASGNIEVTVRNNAWDILKHLDVEVKM